MMKQYLIRFLTLLILAGSLQRADAQSDRLVKESRPCKVLTAGKQLTLISKKTIQHVMLWTPEGHRLVEQKDINSNRLTIEIPVYRKAYFMMVTFTDGKVWTEKVGML